jgi:hypothetical protein
MAWTQLWDMHSGGGLKLPPWHYIYIELPEAEATAYFEQRFERDPYNETCDTCGPDYCFAEAEDLAQLTAYHRGCAWDSATEQWCEEPRYTSQPVVSVDQYIEQPDVLVIRQKDLEEA